METNFIILVLISFSLWFGFLKLAYGIKPAWPKPGSDSENLVASAAKSNEWRWLSDMHTKTPVGSSASMRDTSILLLVPFQRIFRDKVSTFPIVASFSFANIVSVLFIYLISTSYWGPNVALFISLLYLVSFWPWQMSLSVAHLNVGTMFFFMAVYLATQSVEASYLARNFWILASGASFALMLYASSSSPRYIVPFFLAIFFAKHQTLTSALGLSAFYKTILNNDALLSSLVLTGIVAVFLVLLKLTYKKIITAIYDRRAGILNSLIKEKKYPLIYYTELAEEKLSSMFRWFMNIYIFLFIILNVIGFDYLIPILLGFLIIFLALNLPDLKKNFILYFNYIHISYVRQLWSQFVQFIRFGYFARRGIIVSPNIRGGGSLWIVKIYWRMAPFHTLAYVTAIISVVIFNTLTPILDWGTLVLLVLASLSPILWAELTKALQISRAYSSGLAGLSLFIGYGTYIFSERYSLFWVLAITFLAATFFWNLWKFLTDIYPARMTLNNLIKALKKLQIKEIYTYDIPYNDLFFKNHLGDPYLDNLKINYINSLTEVRNGWIFIPSTSIKGAYLSNEAMECGDFEKDPVLNRLLENQELEKIATVKFKTFGTSKIWLHENEVQSYLDLMLGDVTEKDRFRGYAWLLDSNDLNKLNEAR